MYLCNMYEYCVREYQKILSLLFFNQGILSKYPLYFHSCGNIYIFLQIVKMPQMWDATDVDIHNGSTKKKGDHEADF